MYSVNDDDDDGDDDDDDDGDDDDDDDDDDDSVDDDDDDDSVDGDVNNFDFITDAELEVKNTQYKKGKWHVLSSHLQILHADDLKGRLKHEIFHTKAKQPCTTTEYVTVTIDM